MHSARSGIRLRKPDIAANYGSREAFAMCNMRCMSSSLGFWSLDPATGALTCCPTAADILAIAGSNFCMLRDVLVRLVPADRRRLLRTGVKSLKMRTMFDIVVLMRTPNGVRLLRVIGGAGYELTQRHAHIHGLVEQIAPEDPFGTVGSHL
jgi:hypothetical protein